MREGPPAGEPQKLYLCFSSGCFPIHNRHNAADAQPRDFRLPGNLDEVTAERVRRELRLGIADCRFGFAAARDQAKVGAEQQIIERHTFSSAISLHKDPTAFECQIFGRAVLERRARIVAMVKRYCWDFCTGADTWNIKESKALAELLEL